MKKRILSLGIVVMLLVLAVAPGAFSVGMTWHAYVKTSNGKGLNLRSGPSTNNTIIASIPYGAEVHLNDYIDQTWVEVDYGSHHGFVMGRYLTYDKPGPKPTPKPTKKPSGGGGGTSSTSTSIAHLFDGFQTTNYHVIVRPSSPGGFVHMRWAPTKEAAIQSDYHQDDSLEVLAQNNTWAQVRDPNTGATGFMMRSFLRDVGVGAESGSDS